MTDKADEWSIGQKIVLFSMISIFMVCCGVASTPSPEEEKLKRHKGFHCLSNWDGSHTNFKRYVKRNLRNPDSFEHRYTSITSANSSGQHRLTMQYRAQNGFGGTNIGYAKANIDHNNCSFTVISLN